MELSGSVKDLIALLLQDQCI